MKHQNLKFLTLIACFQLCTGFLFASSGIKLIENKGQWKSNVLYKAFIPGGSYFVENGRLTYSFYDQAALHDAMHNHKKTDSIKFHVIRVNFKDANPQVRFINSDSSFESYNYFIGNDASKWASGAKAYGKITLKDLWKGIDLEIITQGDALKYNFIVNPNGNPKSIKLEYEGASNVYLEKQALNIKTTLGQIIEQKPVAYQTGAMDKAGISCSYILNKKGD